MKSCRLWCACPGPWWRVKRREKQTTKSFWLSNQSYSLNWRSRECWLFSLTRARTELLFQILFGKCDCFNLLCALSSFSPWRKHQSRYLQSSFTWIYFERFQMLVHFLVTLLSTREQRHNQFKVLLLLRCYFYRLRSCKTLLWIGNENRLQFTFKCVTIGTCIVCQTDYWKRFNSSPAVQCKITFWVCYLRILWHSSILYCDIDIIVSRRCAHSHRFTHSLSLSCSAANLLSKLSNCIFGLSGFFVLMIECEIDEANRSRLSWNSECHELLVETNRTDGAWAHLISLQNSNCVGLCGVCGCCICSIDKCYCFHVCMMIAITQTIYLFTRKR